MATLSLPVPVGLYPLYVRSLPMDMRNASNGGDNPPLMGTWNKITEVEVTISGTYVDDPGTGGGTHVLAFSGSTTHPFDYGNPTDNDTLGYFLGKSTPWLGPASTFDFKVIGTGGIDHTPDSGAPPTNTPITDCSGFISRLTTTGAFYDTANPCYIAGITYAPTTPTPPWEFEWLDLDENGGTLVYTSSGTTPGGGSWNESVTIVLTV